MKKIISVILSVAVFVSALTITSQMFASNGAKAQAAEVKGYYETADTYLYQSPTTGNWKDWFFIDTALSASNATLGTSNDGRVTLTNGPITSMEILDRNNAVKTELEGFEWEFTFAGIGQVSENQVDMFMFHVNDESDYEAIAKYKGDAGSAGFADAENVFVIARSRRNTDDGLKKDAFTIMQPTFDNNGNSLGLRPIEYTESQGKIIPAESAYMSLPSTSIADINTFMTIKATLKGNELTLQLSIDPTRNTTEKWYYLEKTFTISDEALAAAPKGDFVVSSPRRPSNADGTVSHYKNMTIKEIRFVSDQGVYEPALNALFVNETKRAQWLYLDADKSSASAELMANEGYDGRNVIYEGPAVSQPILSSNNSATADLDDFVWKFEYASAGDARYDLISYFMFHVNENSEYSAIQNYSGKSDNGDAKAGLDDMSNFFAIAYSSDKTADGLKDLAFTVLQPTKVGDKVVLRPISYTEENGVVTPDESAYLSYKGTDLEGNRHNWSTVNVTLEGNKLTLNVQAFSYNSSINLCKTFTLSDEALALAPSGDFAVSCGNDSKNNSNRAALFKGMQIYNYAYSVYTEGLTFEKASTAEGGRVTMQDGRVVISAKKSDGGDTRLITKGITGEKLTDFTLKYSYIPSGTRWIMDSVILRAPDSESVDRTAGYMFSVQGTQHKINNETPNKSSVSIQKDSTSTVKSTPIDSNKCTFNPDFAIVDGREYTVEIEVSGSTVTVWVYEATDSKPTLPTLKYTDPEAKYSSGDIAFYTYSEGFSISDITIIDKKLGTICENWTPELYNSADLNVKQLEGTGMKFGSVTTENGKFTVKTNNGVMADDYPIALNNLNTKALDVFTLDAIVSLADLDENEASVNFGGYKLSLIKSKAGDKAILYKDGQQLAASDVNIIGGKDYVVNVVKDRGGITVKFYKAGSAEPTSSLINVVDDAWLVGGDVWLSTEKGEFTVLGLNLVEGTANENSATDSSYTVLTNSNLIFEKAKSSNSGRITLQNKAIVVSGKNAEDKDGWVVSKGVTGKQLTDYTLKYTYSVADNKWTADAIMLRVQDSENPDRMTGYSFVVQGRGDGKSAGFLVDGQYPAGSVVSIQKNSTAAMTSSTDDANKSVTVLDYTLSVGTDYTVEIEVKGATINAWLYKAGTDKPAEPTVSYTDVEATYKSGDIGFVARGEGFSLSNITLVDKASGTICESYIPELYNGKSFNKSVLNGEERNVGLVTLNNGVYTVISNNGLTDVVYPLETNVLNYNRDTYLSNFELCYELSFNGLENNSASVYFNARDYYENRYELKLNGDGTVVLYKNGLQEKTASFNFIDGVRYQVILNSNEGKINAYIYRLTDAKSSVPTLSYTDKAPLASGVISFGTQQGDFNISKVAVKSYDKVSISGPTGSIFTKNFEGNDYNLDGLNITLNNTDHTALMTDYDGNKYLRIVGKPSNAAKANDITGSDALSQVKFGSNELYNFELSAKIRFKSAFSANWSYLAVGIHANPNRLRNEAIWLDVGTRGSAAVFIDTDENLSNNNMVASTGSVKGTTQSAFLPNEAQADGMAFDGQWHDLKVSVKENTYSLYVDGKFVLSYTDPNNTYEKGAVYLYGYGVNYDLDDIKLTNNLGAGEVKKVDNTVYTNAEGFKLSELQKTDKLTGKQLSEFEWEFEYKADSSNWGRTAFLFGVNKDTKVKNAGANYLEMTNAFGFTITGTNISAKTGKPNVVSGIYNNGITAFAPNTDVTSSGNILPLVYTQEKDEAGKPVGSMLPTYTSTTSSRAALSFADTTSTPIDVGKWMTVKVRFVGNKLYIYTWQTENKAKTFRKQTFTMPMDAVNNITAGDFMIVNGDNGAQIRNIVIRDISVLSKKAK